MHPRWVVHEAHADVSFLLVCASTITYWHLIPRLNVKLTSHSSDSTSHRDQISPWIRPNMDTSTSQASGLVFVFIQGLIHSQIFISSVGPAAVNIQRLTFTAPSWEMLHLSTRFSISRQIPPPVPPTPTPHPPLESASTHDEKMLDSLVLTSTWNSGITDNFLVRNSALTRTHIE